MPRRTRPSRGDDSSLSSPAADLVQLRAVCQALGDWTAPLREIPQQDVPDYLRVILRELKDRLPTRKASPAQTGDPDYTDSRYYGLPDSKAFYAVGLTTVFSEETADVFWLRFHHATPGFEEISRRLRRSPFSGTIRERRGHLWLPLATDAELSGPEQVAEIVAQVKTILAAANPRRELS